MKGDRTNNLKTHLERIHNIIFTGNGVEPSASSSSLSRTQKKATSKKGLIKVDITKRNLFKAYIGLVTEDSLPFNVLNSPNLRSILDPICDGLSALHGKKFRLNSANCRKTVSLVAKKIRDSIKLEVEEKLLSLKIDSASRLSRTVFGISVQFISEDRIQSRLLGMTDLKGAMASTSKKLAEKILHILNLYGISLQQIVSITSDNGANMIKASKLLSEAHISEDEHDAEESNEAYLENLKSFEHFDENVLKVGILQHCRCAAHTCQLCALDVSKDATVKKNLLQCRNLTKFLRKSSNGYRELFEIKRLKVPGLDCATRWGSTYRMVEDLRNARSIIENVDSVTNKSDDDNFELNESLWNFMEAYTKIFGPLQKTIIKFQEEQLNYGDFYAFWLKCKLLTKKIADTGEHNDISEAFLLKTMGQKLLISFETREKKLLNNQGFNACLFLDPRFHHLLSSGKKLEARNFLLKLWEQLKKINPRVCSPEGTADSSDKLSTITVKDDDDENNILNNFLLQGIENSSQQSIDLRTKLEIFCPTFIGSDINILSFWKGKKHMDPDLYLLSTVCFAIPPTQVTVERAFSALKLILSDLRNQLKHDVLEDILLIKLNRDFLDEAVKTLPLFEEEEDFQIE